MRSGAVQGKHLRIAILLTVLLSLLLYAWRDYGKREARTDWQRTLHIALVVVEDEPVDHEVLELLKDRRSAFEARLEAEARRYLSDQFDAFDVHWFGPLRAERPAPIKVGRGFIGRLAHAVSLWRYVWAVDEECELNASVYDARIYLAARPARGEQRFLEGVGQQDGWVGVVQVELARDMVDFALIVAAHELFHVLGARDRYDEHGETRIPEGLAEPDKELLFPQRYFEIMARNRPVTRDQHVPPDDLAELRVGPITASEIGWLR